MDASSCRTEVLSRLCGKCALFNQKGCGALQALMTSGFA
jgi:hypothetical protein